MKSILLINVLIMLFNLQAQAHGEDKPGPHGGYIKMPANFHTELILKPNRDLQIFLLDIEFKNPTTQESSIKVFYKAKNRKAYLKCTPNESFYICKGLPNLFKGTLSIEATRAGVKASLNADYKFPLTEFPKPTPTETPKNNNPHQHH